MESVALHPVPGGRFTFWSTLSPDLFEGVGEAPKYPEDRGSVWLGDAALVFAVGHVQGVMVLIFHAPALLLQTQPLSFTELTRTTRSHQPSFIELALGSNATIYPGQLQGSRQPQLFGFNRRGDDGSILPSPSP